MSSHRSSKLRSLAVAISDGIAWIVTINLFAALAIWWLGWPPLSWLAGASAIATLAAAAIIFVDYWTSRRAWRSTQALGLERHRDYFVRSFRYQLIDETVSERTWPLGVPALVVMLVTGAFSTNAGLLSMATLLLVMSWGGVLRQHELWPPVEPEQPSDSV